MITTKVLEVGAEAIDDKYKMLILFDKTATESLKKVAVIQEVEEVSNLKFDLEVGKKVFIDDKEYIINYIGQLVASSLLEIGHVVLYFKEVPKQPFENGIYLSPTEMPKIHVGSNIVFE